MQMEQRGRMEDCECRSEVATLLFGLGGHATCVSSVPKNGDDPRRSGGDQARRDGMCVL